MELIWFLFITKCQKVSQSASGHSARRFSHTFSKMSASKADTRMAEARHQCDVNSCHEETHMNLRGHSANLKDKPRHSVIKRFAEKCCKNLWNN